MLILSCKRENKIVYITIFFSIKVMKMINKKFIFSLYFIKITIFHTLIININIKILKHCPVTFLMSNVFSCQIINLTAYTYTAVGRRRRMRKQIRCDLNFKPSRISNAAVILKINVVVASIFLIPLFVQFFLYTSYFLVAKLLSESLIHNVSPPVCQS